MVYRVGMVGEFAAEDRRGEQTDMELLLRRARLWDHGLVVVMNRVGEDNCRGDASAGKNALMFCARGSIKGA